MQSSPQQSVERTSVQPQITLSSGLLTVTAQNSSLNQILREVGRATGMRITGAISDEKVFGSYGPASPQVVLSQLLDGTGTNILLHEDAQHAVRELVLTPRQGGVTPPDPSAANRRDQGSLDNPLVEERRRRGPGAFSDQNQPGRQNNPPLDPTQPASFLQPAQPGRDDQPSNAVKTPQQLQQEQLMQQHLTPPQEAP